MKWTHTQPRSLPAPTVPPSSSLIDQVEHAVPVDVAGRDGRAAVLVVRVESERRPQDVAADLPVGADLARVLGRPARLGGGGAEETEEDDEG